MKKHVYSHGWTQIKSYKTILRYINEKGYRLMTDLHIADSAKLREFVDNAFEQVVTNSEQLKSLPGSVVLGVLRETGPFGTPGPYLGDFIQLSKTEFCTFLALYKDEIEPEFFESNYYQL